MDRSGSNWSGGGAKLPMRPNCVTVGRDPYSGRLSGLGDSACFDANGDAVDCSSADVATSFPLTPQQVAVSAAANGPVVSASRTAPFPPAGPVWTENSTLPSSVSVSPTTLLWGVGLLAFASFFLGGRVEP